LLPRGNMVAPPGANHVLEGTWFKLFLKGIWLLLWGI